MVVDIRPGFFDPGQFFVPLEKAEYENGNGSLP